MLTRTSTSCNQTVCRVSRSYLSGSPDILFTGLLYNAKCQSQKREIIQSNIYRILPNVWSGHVHVHNLWAKYHDPSLSGSRDICSQRSFMGWMSKSEKGNNSVNFWQHFMKSLSGNLHHVAKLYAWFHDPISSGSPDILFIRLLYNAKCQSQKREMIQSNIHRSLPTVNQVIYFLNTIYEPNSMILAEAVCQIFCSQCPLWG